MALPDEIWGSILDYLEPVDIISCQRLSKRLFGLARENMLWRYKCFEKAPSAATITADRSHALFELTGALGGLSLSGNGDPPTDQIQQTRISKHKFGTSKRARKVRNWDRTNGEERIDWHSEYIARHAPLSTIWGEDKTAPTNEVRGVALYESQKLVGCLEDGSIRIWDIRDRSSSRQRFQKLAQSKPGLLFQSSQTSGESSIKSNQSSFSGWTECVSVDTWRRTAYIAVGRTLNEIDLETLQPISQLPYAWDITALSQVTSNEPLSVGTTWSLSLYDPRVPMRDRSRSPEDLVRTEPGPPEDSIAFLPNYLKTRFNGMMSPLPTGPASDPRETQILDAASRGRGRAELSDYAHMEPGPLSILHHADNDILLAGRFPSILSYDRRYFPRLQYVIHSGARLSCLTSIPYPPPGSCNSLASDATLIAAGEYGGRGSLEMYCLPHNRMDATQASEFSGTTEPSPEVKASDQSETTTPTEQEAPYSYKNRQEASSAKLLSVATQGSRIIFSDAEGGLKWVERDGRGLARRWNINAWQFHERELSITSDLVARKIIPLPIEDSERGARGDGDLLIWTGEKVGIVTTRPQFEDHEELVKSFEGLNLGEKEEQEKAEEYSKAMRQALERQADERRWMSRFRLKRGLP